MLINYKDTLEMAGLILGVATSLIVATKQGRDWLVAKWKNYQQVKKVRSELPYFIQNINTKMDAMDNRLKKIEYETTPNSGGTLMGFVKLIKAEIEATNWLSPRPTFRTTSSGLNVFVNEAYCQLCGVTSEELMRLGWKNFAADSDDLDDFYDRWLQSSQQLSPFSGRLKLQNKNGEYRGEWTVRIRLLGPIDSINPVPEYLWHGGLYPFDQKAKEYAKENGIA